MRVKIVRESVEMGLLINLHDLYLCGSTLHCNVWRDKYLCGTNLCDRRLTRIIRINKKRTEKCCFTVVHFYGTPSL